MVKWKPLFKNCIHLLFALPVVFAAAQPVIHSHNDYTHTLAFWDAYNNKAGVIEADVYEVNGELMVAHSKAEIKPGNSLNSLYIQPIVKLFDSTKNNMHSFYLMIDVKEDQSAVLKILTDLLQQHPSVFNRHINKNAVQVFISGERPPDSTFHTYSNYIMFDGLPGRNYAVKDLQKIVMLSDNFRNYSTWNGTGKLPAEDSIKIENMISAAHALGKPVRLWGAPDSEQCWRTLVNLHADVINTDKVEACRQFLDKINMNSY